MAVSYQEINEILASEKSSDEILKANRFLTKGVGSKPEWLEDFLESNESKLKETILRAISSREGMSSLSGYNEGYFNEIIQNANDLHDGDVIDIELSTDGTVYTVKCIYQDKGFNLSNIYAFLNREMSDKSSEKGQTGQFGVGIKSFFKFVQKFRIESNVVFDFTIDRDANRITDSVVCVNDNWDREKTVLSFEFTRDKKDESSFNTRKLCDLIDYFDGNKECDISDFFLSGKDENMVFDIHSLIFMNRNQDKKAISKIDFYGKNHNLSFEFENIYTPQTFEYESEKWRIMNNRLVVIIDDSEPQEFTYITFIHGTISLCFPLTTMLEGDNRIYSTYYIKSDSEHNLCPIGMLIDTKSANIHRNDLGDNEAAIKDAYKKIITVFKDMLWFMCSPEIKEASCLNEISDIFHSILFAYIDVDKNAYKESPFNQENLESQYLPKLPNDPRTDIVFHNNEEHYQKCSVLDKNSVEALTETYFQFIEKENVIDYNELQDSEEFIYGVYQIYQKIHRFKDYNEDTLSLFKMLHYFPGVAEYITYVISKDYRIKPSLSDNEIDEWLLNLKHTLKDNYNQELFIKLIGRYGLNDAIAYDGTLRQVNLNFRDYLFNGLPELKDGILSNWRNEHFDHQYYDFKREITGNRLTDPGNKNNTYKIRYIEPKGASRRGWDHWYDYYGHNIIKCDVSEKNKLLFLGKIASNYNLASMISTYKMWLFEKKVILMRCRDDYFKHRYPDREQQILYIDFLRKINLTDFGDFLHAIEYRKNIQKINSDFNISIKCNQTSVRTLDIVNNFLPHLVELNEENSKTAYLLSEYSIDDVIIHSIEDNKNNELPEENRRFIHLVSGYNIHLSSFDSKSRKYMISYFGNRTAAIKTSAKDSFKPIATYYSSDKNIYIFYDNAPDKNEVVASVLKELKISKNLMDLLTGYIHNGNDTKTMNYLARRRIFAKVKKGLEWDWPDITSNDLTVSEDTEVMYRLLTARGSYDIYCPICSDIPLETFNYGEDTKNKHSRKIIVMENENQTTNAEFPYIITVGCSYCFEKLRNTLSKSEFDGTSITLTTQIAQGQHERMRSRHQIKLSPVNIQIMKNFKFGKNNR